MAEKFLIEGGKILKGEIKVKGSKNTALKVLAASLLTDELWTVSNVPQIEDIFRTMELLEKIGVKINSPEPGTYELQAKKIETSRIDSQIGQRLKTSILMAGPLLIRKGAAEFPHPGGCVIGQRPRDLFLDGFKAFGANIEAKKESWKITAKKIKGAKFVFPLISVTATEAMILMAVLAQGRTVLKNAACEPEIVALTIFLNLCGAKIKGAGSPLIEIEGVKYLKKGKCQIIPDRIEAGSFVILGLAAKSPIKITNLDPEHLEVLWLLLKKAGADLKIGKDYVLINSIQPLKAVDVRTHEYPGFPTDLQPPFGVLMTQAKGLSLIHETIFEGRLFYTDFLNQMGAKIIMADPHRVLVQGPTKLCGRRVVSPDIRAGIALLIAALTAKGKSVIENVYQIDRGYEKIEDRLKGIGAGIERIDE
ncbi:UDP-N-acetylglucosamine 1-carboxyvinyltransferase [Patescibacteria group bacterium]|nr:UDP-N-acetylglucosamine 1-carboxyvinyltransferase [Patescibacteria group bacterium]